MLEAGYLIGKLLSKCDKTNGVKMKIEKTLDLFAFSSLSTW